MPPSNIFNAPAEEIRELFCDYLDGGAEAIALVLSSSTLDEASHNALEKSLESFGYEAASCTFATLLPANPHAEGRDIPLDAQSLFLLVEGLDPLIVICTDAECARQLESSYRCRFSLDAPARVFGRSAVVYADFSSLLSTQQGKQLAWRLLKSLPKNQQ